MEDGWERGAMFISLRLIQQTIFVGLCVKKKKWNKSPIQYILQKKKKYIKKWNVWALYLWEKTFYIAFTQCYARFESLITKERIVVSRAVSLVTNVFPFFTPTLKEELIFLSEFTVFSIGRRKKSQWSLVQMFYPCLTCYHVI